MNQLSVSDKFASAYPGSIWDYVISIVPEYSVSRVYMNTVSYAQHLLSRATDECFVGLSDIQLSMRRVEVSSKRCMYNTFKSSYKSKVPIVDRKAHPRHRAPNLMATYYATIL